ncbi:hypothetical protein SAMN05444374_10753 [Rhodococcoides kroppenstedtii]|uniref:DUF3592 domain-containing protein n=1 Tax=Rhodococcoides kroppenstedtii TaxID=293050 RepID=A0A1I0TK18_9NOCA|nr:hypothetical protein SAMN05444374_10753 [Rhodococcus kroppenstedtii]
MTSETTETGGTPGTAAPRRRRPLAVTVLTVLATAISVLAVLLVLAAWRNDHTISSDEGVATAEVLSAGRLRSAVSFVTPDGEMHNPRLGVLYPTNLVAGQRIDVEYARSEPDLVRVAGRDASVAVIPALSVVVVTWAIAGPLILVLRRRAQ